MKQNPNCPRQQKIIFNVSNTCSAENLLEYNQFLLAYPYIVEELEAVYHKRHLEKYPKWRQQNTESRRRISALVKGIATFELCIAWIIVFKSWFYLRGPTKKIKE